MPRIHTESARGQTTIALWEIIESLDEITEGLNLSRAEADFVATAHPRRAREWAASRRLVRELTGPDTLIQCLNDSAGKPYLANDHRHLSISHSHGMAAVAISDHPVGIDIQVETDKILRIAEKFVSESEVLSAGEPHRRQKLLLCWSAKEAMFKLYGKGGVDFRGHLRVEIPQNPIPYGTFRGSIRMPGETPVDCEIQYRFIRNYLLAYALPH